MASFVVMQRRMEGGAVEGEFVRDGFHLIAFLVPLLWFLFHRMWIEAAVVLAFMVAFAILTTWAGYPLAWPFSLILSMFAGMEGSSLRLSAMRRAGWQEQGVVEADDAFGAEARYTADAQLNGLADGPSNGEAAPAMSTPPKASHAPGPALGLFSYPGGR